MSAAALTSSECVCRWVWRTITITVPMTTPDTFHCFSLELNIWVFFVTVVMFTEGGTAHTYTHWDDSWSWINATGQREEMHKRKHTVLKGARQCSTNTKLCLLTRPCFSGIFLYLTKSNQQTQNKTSATAKHRRSHSSQTSKFQIKGPLCLNHVRKRSLHKLGYCSAGSGSAEFEPSSGISTWTCSWVSNVQVATGTVPWLSDGSCLTFLQR